LGVVSDALKWLDTSDAAKAARREIRRLRLPLSEDDLLQETRVRLLRTGGPSTAEADNAIGYAHRALQNAACDLHRRRRRRVVEDVLPDDEVLVGTRWSVDDVKVPSQLEDECRRAVHGSLAARPWAGAAVLNELTFRLHHDVPIPREAPSPDGGTDEQECCWAALWLAGKLDCFPTLSELEDDAMRQRRSRSLRVVRDGLEHAVRVAVAGDGG
jgi:hypothetical protein